MHVFCEATVIGSVIAWAGAFSSPLRKGRVRWAKVEQSKAALSPAWSSHRLYLPASLGLHCIWDQSYPSIYTPLLCASWAPALILYLMLPRIHTCSNNAGRFQKRSMMADIYQTSLRAYLGLNCVTYFDLEIKEILDERALSDTFDKYQESHFAPLMQNFGAHCGCVPAMLVHLRLCWLKEKYMHIIM